MASPAPKRCPKCFNFLAYCTCTNIKLVADNTRFPCICCDAKTECEHVPMLGWVCDDCAEHVGGHPMEAEALHRRQKIWVENVG